MCVHQNEGGDGRRQGRLLSGPGVAPAPCLSAPCFLVRLCIFASLNVPSCANVARGRYARERGWSKSAWPRARQEALQDRLRSLAPRKEIAGEPGTCSVWAVRGHDRMQFQVAGGSRRLSCLGGSIGCSLQCCPAPTRLPVSNCLPCRCALLFSISLSPDAASTCLDRCTRFSCCRCG